MQLSQTSQYGNISGTQSYECVQRAAKAVRAMQQPTRLVLVRHGETDWNVQRRMQGQLTDKPAPCLTLQGRLQAEQLGRYLQSHHGAVSAIVTSDLLRARQVCW
jgi:2,3-bisphosphoglycerate-dependent phosphoglycerate mutase